MMVTGMISSIGLQVDLDMKIREVEMEFINERIHFTSNLTPSLKFLNRRIIPFFNLLIVNPEMMSEVGAESSGASQRMRRSLVGLLERMLFEWILRERMSRKNIGFHGRMYRLYENGVHHFIKLFNLSIFLSLRQPASWSQCWSIWMQNGQLQCVILSNPTIWRDVGKYPRASHIA
jgi:hypothetical protein